MSDRDMNFILFNTGRSVSPNFHFMLRVEGLFDLPCKAIHSFKKANEYEYIQEGGLNDYVHMRRKPISKPFTFEVERYVGVDILDPLQPGTELVLPVVLMVWRRVMYKNFTPFRVYTFTGCTVMEKKYGELNAEKSGLLEETTTIGYREMMRMTMPAGVFDDFGDNFDIAQELTPTDGQPKTESYKHRKAIPDERSTDAEKRIWLGFDPNARDSKTITETDPIKDGEKLSIASAHPDDKSSKGESRAWNGFNPKAEPASKYNDDNPAPEGTILTENSAHPDERSSLATQRLWNGFNPDAKSPSDFDEDNPAPKDTVFTVSSAHPDERSTEATGTLYDIKTGETTSAIPDDKSTKATGKLYDITAETPSKSARPDERSTDATGKLYDITSEDASKSAKPDERSSAATGTMYNIKNGTGKKVPDDDKSSVATGTMYNIKDGSGKRVPADEKSSAATQVLWPGATAQDKPPKTLRANVLRTLNS